jgi:hypothetical protein
MSEIGVILAVCSVVQTVVRRNQEPEETTERNAKNQSIKRGEEKGGPKPTHRLAPAVRQDTKYRLWRPK